MIFESVQIFESESNLTCAEFEAEKAQRQSNRYQINITRDPQNSHLASFLVSVTDRVTSCLKSAETHRKQANFLRQSLTMARQHRFTRPPSPIHQSWNVSLPDKQSILKVLSSGSPDDLVLDDRGFRITRKTMQRLAWPAVSREQYLDTSIIDTYLALAAE